MLFNTANDEQYYMHEKLHFSIIPTCMKQCTYFHGKEMVCKFLSEDKDGACVCVLHVLRDAVSQPFEGCVPKTCT